MMILRFAAEGSKVVKVGRAQACLAHIWVRSGRAGVCGVRGLDPAAKTRETLCLSSAAGRLASAAA